MAGGEPDLAAGRMQRLLPRRGHRRMPPELPHGAAGSILQELSPYGIPGRPGGSQIPVNLISLRRTDCHTATDLQPLGKLLVLSSPGADHQRPAAMALPEAVDGLNAPCPVLGRDLVQPIED